MPILYVLKRANLLGESQQYIWGFGIFALKTLSTFEESVSGYTAGVRLFWVPNRVPLDIKYININYKYIHVFTHGHMMTNACANLVGGVYIMNTISELPRFISVTTLWNGSMLDSGCNCSYPFLVSLGHHSSNLRHSS